MAAQGQRGILHALEVDAVSLQSLHVVLTLKNYHGGPVEPMPDIRVMAGRDMPQLRSLTLELIKEGDGEDDNVDFETGIIDIYIPTTAPKLQYMKIDVTMGVAYGVHVLDDENKQLDDDHEWRSTSLKTLIMEGSFGRSTGLPALGGLRRLRIQQPPMGGIWRTFDHFDEHQLEQLTFEVDNFLPTGVFNNPDNIGWMRHLAAIDLSQHLSDEIYEYMVAFHDFNLSDDAPANRAVWIRDVMYPFDYE